MDILVLSVPEDSFFFFALVTVEPSGVSRKGAPPPLFGLYLRLLTLPF